MLVAQNSLGPVCPVPLTVRGKGIMLHAYCLRVPGVVDVSCPPPAWWRDVPLGLALDDVL